MGLRCLYGFRVLDNDGYVKLVLFLAVFIFVFSISISPVAGSQVVDEFSRAVVLVDDDGVAVVSITIYRDPSLDEAFIIGLPAPAVPESIDVSPIEVVAQILPNGSLALLKPRGVDRIDITYIAEIVVSDGAIGLRINAPEWVESLIVKIHRSVIPITIPENIENLRVFGEYILFEIPRNSTWMLEYVLIEEDQVGDTQIQTTIPAEVVNEDEPSEEAPINQDLNPPIIPGIPGIPPIILVAILILGLTAGLTYLYRTLRGRSRARGEDLLSLDQVDRQIIEAVEGYGEATAKEIMEATGLPKSTLYRRLKKLSDMGIIGSKVRSGVTYYYKINTGESSGE